tara:strand:- start:11656 stop:12429 length:774 start_codon:yes stop_codon:yes gene_type:complete
MLKPRVIPVLLIDEERLVKTKKFSNPLYVGDPINVVKIFNDKECDELILVDISASKKGAAPNFEYLKEIASECFMPMTYGGGITSMEQATTIFKLGFEKICLNSSLYKNPNLVCDLVNKFGSQSIVASLDIKNDWRGKARPYDYAKKNFLNFTVEEVIEYVKNLRVGELLLNFVDKDGLMKGSDPKIIKIISSCLDIPVVGLGGVSSLEDIALILQSGASAAAAGSFFVYYGPLKAVLISYLDKSQFDHLTKKLTIQ